MRKTNLERWKNWPRMTLAIHSKLSAELGLWPGLLNPSALLYSRCESTSTMESTGRGAAYANPALTSQMTRAYRSEFLATPCFLMSWEVFKLAPPPCKSQSQLGKGGHRHRSPRTLFFSSLKVMFSSPDCFRVLQEITCEKGGP